MADQMKPFEGYVDGDIYVKIRIDKNSIVTFMFSEDKNGMVPADISGRCVAVFAAITKFGDLNPDFRCMTTIIQGKDYFISRYSKILWPCHTIHYKESNNMWLFIFIFIFFSWLLINSLLIWHMRY